MLVEDQVIQFAERLIGNLPPTITHEFMTGGFAYTWFFDEDAPEVVAISKIDVEGQPHRWLIETQP